jgi:hypothetical protein
MIIIISDYIPSDQTKGCTVGLMKVKEMRSCDVGGGGAGERGTHTHTQSDEL